MSQYIFIILWIGTIAIVFNLLQTYRMENVLGVRSKRMIPIAAFIVFLPIIIMAMNRGIIGDTGAYLQNFSRMPTSFVGIPDFMLSVKKDPGFSIFSCIIKCIFGDSEKIYLLVIALTQGILLISVFRKYTEYYLIAILLFVLSTDFHSWMFNGMRQFMAVVIIFAATKLMLEKKYIPLILIIIFASTMHQSALLMIPVVIIANGKAWNKKTLFFLMATLLVVIFVDEFTPFLDEMMKDTQYSNMVTDWTKAEDDGTNPIRVLVYSIPTIISIFGIKYINKANDQLINLCVNMSIFSTGLYIVSMFTSGVFIGRLPIYASLQPIVK